MVASAHLLEPISAFGREDQGVATTRDVASRSGRGADDARRDLPSVRRPDMNASLDRTNLDIVRLWWATQRNSRALREYRRLRSLTDGLLDYLERLNMQHPQGRELDDSTRNAIRGVLAEVPGPSQRRFPECRTVQEALDGVFELKGELRRQALPDEVLLRWDCDSDEEA
jgi:hypothetical protein